mmetsp:Transcript_60069/g.99715  ORF Transcript_60069/g.99715 Transcript_60069/m.99715 type:complete len:257 (-) Transcript_60069:723-1493(-)
MQFHFGIDVCLVGLKVASLEELCPCGLIEEFKGIVNSLVHVKVLVVGQPANEYDLSALLRFSRKVLVLFIEVTIALRRNRIVRLSRVTRRLHDHHAVPGGPVQIVLVFHSTRVRRLRPWVVHNWCWKDVAWRVVVARFGEDDRPILELLQARRRKVRIDRARVHNLGTGAFQMALVIKKVNAQHDLNQRVLEHCLKPCSVPILWQRLPFILEVAWVPVSINWDAGQYRRVHLTWALPPLLDGVRFKDCLVELLANT